MSLNQNVLLFVTFYYNVVHFRWLWFDKFTDMEKFALNNSFENKFKQLLQNFSLI